MNEEIKIVKKEYDENEVIMLRALYGHQQGPYFACPVKDPITQQIKGARQYTPAERLSGAEDVFEITGDMMFPIVDGTKFHMNNARERAIWNCIKHNPKIATSRDETNWIPDAIYFVENLEEELEEKISLDERIFKAESFIRESSSVRRAEICTLMGKQVRYLTERNVLDFLIDSVRDKKNKGYVKIVAVQAQFENGTAKAMLAVKQMLDKGIIKQDFKSKIISFGDIPMGLNEDQVVNYLKNKENQVVRDQLTLLLAPNG